MNSGDPNYSKSEDDGLIIRQTRVNFQAWPEPKNEVINSAIAEVSVDFGLGLVNDLLSVCHPVLSYAISKVSDIVKGIRDFKKAVESEKISVNTSAYLATEQSKAAQRDDPNAYYTRNTRTIIDQQQVYLAPDDGSFFELVAMLDTTDYRTEMLRVCCFKIVSSRNPDNYLLNKDGEEGFFTFNYSYLYNDNNHTNVYNDSQISNLPVYLLPQGDQYFDFTPEYSGNYNFVTPTGTYIELDGKQVTSPNLKKNQKYIFRLVNTLSKTLIGNMSIGVSAITSAGSVSVSANDDRIVTYRPSVSDYVCLKIDMCDKVKVDVLDENFDEISLAGSDQTFAYLSADKTYYLHFRNTASIKQIGKLIVQPVPSMDADTDIRLTNIRQVYSFENGDKPAQYQLVASNIGSQGVKIKDSSGNNMRTQTEIVNSKYVYTFSLSAHAKCYFELASVTAGATVRLSIAADSYRWKVDGEIVDGYYIKLKPNAIYNIVAEKLASDDSYVEAYAYRLLSDGVDAQLVSGGLRIGNASKSAKLILIPVAESDSEVDLASELVIEIDDFITEIYLNHGTGTGYDGVIKVELNTRIPSNDIFLPIRPGYRFLGYFDAVQGESNARMYISETLECQIWDKDEDRFVLYAHWEPITYTLTVDNGDGNIKKYSLRYGDLMPDIPLAPKKSGYGFLGYYTKPNGDGNKVYTVTSELVDDIQAAQIYGYDHYYVEGIEYCYSTAYWEWQSDMTLYASWEPLTCIYFVKETLEGEVDGTSQRVYLQHGVPIQIKARDIQGGEFKYFVLGGEVVTENPFTWVPSLTRDVTTGEVVPTQSLRAIYTQSECIAAGTLITLADGRQVPVEQLTGNEMLLVWNLLTGQFDSAKILFIDKHETKVYNVINLEFSDGTVVKVIAEHAFWDYDLNKYVYLDRSAADYIGHWFCKQTVDLCGDKCNSKVQLVGVSVSEEYIAAYSPVTYGHLCYYVNGMLSIPGGIGGLFNIFDVDGDALTINAEQMKRDIEQYGLFTYEEFVELVPVTEDVFNAFNGQYLKVAIGKGLTDIDSLKMLAARYAEYLM